MGLSYQMIVKLPQLPTGLLASHDGHEHFIFYKQLVNSKWEKLIPYQYLNKAKDEYAELEKEVNDKINYLSKKNNIAKDKFSYVITSNGDAISYNGKTELLKRYKYQRKYRDE